jgi:hypothetical protein
LAGLFIVRLCAAMVRRRLGCCGNASTAPKTSYKSTFTAFEKLKFTQPFEMYLTPKLLATFKPTKEYT